MKERELEDVEPETSERIELEDSGETLAGTLGVIGPARREYPRVIPVVELLGRALSERLERRERREKQGASK